MRQYAITNDSDYLDALESPKTPVWELIEQLGSKQAWAVRDTANGIVCLQSYHTIVSYKAGDETVHLGRWSVTTSRHQSEFACRCY